MKIIALLFLPYFGFSQIKLEPKTIFNGKIEISIPVDLSEVDNPFSSVSGYELLFANRAKDIILSISYPSEPLNLKQFYAYERFLIKYLKQDYPNIIVSDSGVVNINERQIGFIECHEAKNDQTVYTSIYFSSVDGRVFKISLEYVKEHQAQWKNISKDIIGTLKVY